MFGWMTLPLGTWQRAVLAHRGPCCAIEGPETDFRARMNDRSHHQTKMNSRVVKKAETKEAMKNKRHMQEEAEEV